MSHRSFLHLSSLAAVLVALAGCNSGDESTDTSSDELVEQGQGTEAQGAESFRSPAAALTEANEPAENPRPVDAIMQTDVRQ